MSTGCLENTKKDFLAEVFGPMVVASAEREESSESMFVAIDELVESTQVAAAYVA